MLPRAHSTTEHERDVRNQKYSRVQQLQQRRNSQSDLSAHVTGLPSLESGGSSNLSSPGTEHGGSPIGVVSAEHTAELRPAASKTTGAAVDVHENDQPAEAELARQTSRSKQVQHVEQRLGAFEQIALISTLLVGTAAGALLVVDREKVGEYQCGLDQQPDGSAATGLCDAKDMPLAVWVAVMPLHLTIGLNLFVTLVFVLVAFNTKRTMGW